MGIHKSNVRFVLHYHLPKDLESYYQEIGRAGRDGLPADCLMLHSRTDASTIRHFIDRGAASERPGRLARLNAMLEYADAIVCRRQSLLAYFGERPMNHCRSCDNCLRLLAPTQQTDVTRTAQLFLTCVRQTGEVFGATHLVQILRGSRSKRITSRNHDRLSTHGAGKEFPADLWHELLRQFIAQRLVDQEPKYGSIRLALNAQRVLQGEKVFACLDAAEAPFMVPRPEGEPPYAPELFQRLRCRRKELADLADVPPYVIFSDRTLVDMATRRPQNEQQFLALHGVGEIKLTRYAAAFLEVIRNYELHDPAPRTATLAR